MCLVETEAVVQIQHHMVGWLRCFYEEGQSPAKQRSHPEMSGLRAEAGLGHAAEPEGCLMIITQNPL